MRMISVIYAGLPIRKSHVQGSCDLDVQGQGLKVIVLFEILDPKYMQ